GVRQRTHGKGERGIRQGGPPVADDGGSYPRVGVACRLHEQVEFLPAVERGHDPVKEWQVTGVALRPGTSVTKCR
ncbi:MAG: hypothetical protein JWO87_3131, partial [Phycisphaerales bacterium]|nr:hypothetical protein [Phycisphaerales bacterium]